MLGTLILYTKLYSHIAGAHSPLPLKTVHSRCNLPRAAGDISLSKEITLHQAWRVTEPMIEEEDQSITSEVNEACA